MTIYLHFLQTQTAPNERILIDLSLLYLLEDKQNRKKMILSKDWERNKIKGHLLKYPPESFSNELKIGQFKNNNTSGKMSASQNTLWILKVQRTKPEICSN